MHDWMSARASCTAAQCRASPAADACRQCHSSNECSTQSGWATLSALCPHTHLLDPAFRVMILLRAAMAAGWAHGLGGAAQSIGGSGRLGAAAAMAGRP